MEATIATHRHQEEASWLGSAPAARASFGQERIWFFAQLAPDSAMYHLAAVARVRGNIDVVALARSIDCLVTRHASLRTTLAMRGGRLVQQIAAPSSGWLQFIDAGGDEAELERRLHEAAVVRFDLEHGPLFRAQLLRVGPADHALLLAGHHAVADGLSLRIFLSDLDRAYRAFKVGAVPALPTLHAQYTDYAAWQREQLDGPRLTELLGYWRHQLADLPAALELPTDHPRPSLQSYCGASHRVALPAVLVERLTTIARSENTTLFTLLLSTFAAWLGSHCGCDDIVVGIPVANRARREFRRLFGLLVNTVPIRIDLLGEPSLRQLCRKVSLVCEQAYRHQDLPFEKLVETLQPERRLDRSPICQVMFAFQGVPAALELDGLRAEILLVDTGSAQFDLALGLNEHADGLSGAIEYNRDLFDAPTIARWAHHFELLLELAAAEPDRSLHLLPSMDSAEHDQVVRTFNSHPHPNSASTQARTDEPLIHRLFEHQAARTPTAVAVAFGTQALSYAQLDARAQQLASRLRAMGVGCEHHVGVLLDRSLALPIALLAVLKAGGAYVPLDPSLPQDRLRTLLEDSAPLLLLTESKLARTCAFAGATLLVDEIDVNRELPAFDASSLVLHPDAAAYVIYTSGSTGKPKGVVATHRGVCNHLQWYAAALDLGPTDRVLQKYSSSFDAAMTELFAPLIAGACVVIASTEVATDAAALARLLAEQEITAADFVPSLLELVIDEPAFSCCPHLRHLVCGGEPLPTALLARLRSTSTATLHNMYGPTETTIGATAWTVSDSDTRRISVPIGRPIANTQVYVLSPGLEPVPIGVFGELGIGGLGVSRGYLDRPALTAERFVPDPFSTQPGARLFRSGDRCRWLADGVLEFAGREDGQIKWHGFRIELGEIESVLRQHPDLQEALVLIEPDLHCARSAPAEPSEADPPDFIKRRAGDFELSLRISTQFLQPPRAAQRNWLLRRALDEAADDLVALDRTARGFVRGSERIPMSGEWQQSRAAYDASQLIIQNQQVMQDWEAPLMQAMARIAAASHGDVLEIGFGMGISSTFIQELGVRSHTIIECNADVIERFKPWRAGYPGRDIRLSEGRWQDAIEKLALFDAVLFDTYPVSEEEFVASVINDVTFAQHFFAAAARHLRPGGVFTYYSNEIDSFSRRHQRLLLEHFASFELSVVKPLRPPADCDYWWADSMVAVKAVKSAA